MRRTGGRRLARSRETITAEKVRAQGRACGTGIAQSTRGFDSIPRRQPYASQQVLEARIVAQRIDKRQAGQVAHARIVLVNRLLQPFECPVLVSESTIDGGD